MASIVLYDWGRLSLSRSYPHGIAKSQERDGRCLCCGAKRSLEVDHILQKYFWGNNILDNMQTLCGECNRLKGTDRINFRDVQTDLTMPPKYLPNLNSPTGKKAAKASEWKRFLYRKINFSLFNCPLHCLLSKYRHTYVHLFYRDVCDSLLFCR